MTEKLGVFFLNCENGLVDSTNTFTNVTNNYSAFAVYGSDARSGTNSMSAIDSGDEDVVISFNIPNNTYALNFEEDTAGSTTLDFWVKLENVVGRCPLAYVGYSYFDGGSWKSAPFLQLEYNRANERIYAVIYYGIESTIPIWINNITFSSGWNHLAMVVQHATDNTTTVKLYLNGIMIGSTTGSGYTPYTSFYKALDIGVGYENSGLAYIVDNVRLNNDALWVSNFDTTKEADMFYPLGTYGNSGSGGGGGIAVFVNTTIPNNIVTSQTPSVTVSGTAPDGTVEVIWINNTYDTAGTASGTETWVIEDLPLNNSLNKVDIIAIDSDGGTTTESLDIRYLPNYSKLSFIYKDKGIRGSAKQGFIRPTIKQFFTSETYEEILK